MSLIRRKRELNLDKISLHLHQKDVVSGVMELWYVANGSKNQSNYFEKLASFKVGEIHVLFVEYQTKKKEQISSISGMDKETVYSYHGILYSIKKKKKLQLHKAKLNFNHYVKQKKNIKEHLLHGYIYMKFRIDAMFSNESLGGKL